jgi:hypothetical protein
MLCSNAARSLIIASSAPQRWPSLHREIGPVRSTWHDPCMVGSILTPIGHHHRPTDSRKNHALCVTLVTFQIQTHAFSPFPTPRHCEWSEAIQSRRKPTKQAKRVHAEAQRSRRRKANGFAQSHKASAHQQQALPPSPRAPAVARPKAGPRLKAGVTGLGDASGTPILWLRGFVRTLFLLPPLSPARIRLQM